MRERVTSLWRRWFGVCTCSNVYKWNRIHAPSCPKYDERRDG